MYFTLIEIRRS